jgi:hypothetical protein
MQEYVFDGIKRDRLVWVGDLHPELRAINAVFGDNVSLRNSLDLARNQTPLPGWINGICSYSLWWIINHRDYYMYHGDKVYLQEQYAYLKQLLYILMDAVDETGKEYLTGSRSFDWPTSENKNAIDAGLQALTLMALDAGAQLISVLGDTQTVKDCNDKISLMRQVIPDYTTSKQSAALIALTGLIPADKVNEDIIAANGVKDFSTYYGYYMLQAKAKAGDYIGAINNINEYWGSMLDLGATTFWEDFNIEWIKNAGRIDELVPKDKIDVHKTYSDYCYKGLRHSLCHGWSSGPTAWLSEHVLGIQIVEPGCKTVRISPHLGMLEWVEGTFPTPFGVIKVKHHKLPDGRIDSKIFTPKQIKIIKTNILN